MTVDASQQASTVEPWIPTDSEFGSRLALIRHRMGWNVKEAARECGLAAATWRLWEVDGALPRNIVTVSMAISQRVGCDYLWLVHGPDRGGARPTTGYAQQAGTPTTRYAAAHPVVVAGAGRKKPAHSPRAGFHTPHGEPTRAVTQTQPLRKDPSLPNLQIPTFAH